MVGWFAKPGVDLQGLHSDSALHSGQRCRNQHPAQPIFFFFFLAPDDFYSSVLFRWPCSCFPANLLLNLRHAAAAAAAAFPTNSGRRRRLEIRAPNLTQVAIIMSFGCCVRLSLRKHVFISLSRCVHTACDGSLQSNTGHCLVFFLCIFW